MTEIWDPAIANDPDAFVRFIFPWGKEGTPLHDKKGPRNWQRDELLAFKDHIADNLLRVEMGQMPKIYRSVTASGRGVGKSALVAWLDLWMISCQIGGSAVNSANTEAQLKTRTWAEVGIWHTLSFNSHWFERQTMSLKPAKWYAEGLKNQLKIDNEYYYAMAQLWSEETTEAFAGIHNSRGVMLIFDEASGIPEKIWEVADGFFVDESCYHSYFAFSNPRRNTGAFFQCFHKNRQYWNRRNLDARKVDQLNIEYLNEMVERYGEDSDAARVEVYGQFPRQGDKQFISREVIENASTRELSQDLHAGIVMGVDPARFGSDTTVIRFRQGRDARSFPVIRMKGKDNMQVANECAYQIDRINPDAVCIDSGGGAGIIDRLREMGYKVNEVGFGEKSSEPEWANKRTEIWAKMREWLIGGCINDEIDLIDDLAGPEYKYMGASDKLMLESKEDMKRRGIASPDDGDALACTFAVRVAHRDLRASRKNPSFRVQQARDIDYDFFG